VAGQVVGGAVAVVVVAAGGVAGVSQAVAVGVGLLVGVGDDGRVVDRRAVVEAVGHPVVVVVVEDGRAGAAVGHRRPHAGLLHDAGAGLAARALAVVRADGRRGDAAGPGGRAVGVGGADGRARALARPGGGGRGHGAGAVAVAGVAEQVGVEVQLVGVRRAHAVVVAVGDAVAVPVGGLVAGGAAPRQGPDGLRRVVDVRAVVHLVG